MQQVERLRLAPPTGRTTPEGAVTMTFTQSTPQPAAMNRWWNPATGTVGGATRHAPQHHHGASKHHLVTPAPPPWSRTIRRRPAVRRAAATARPERVDPASLPLRHQPLPHHQPRRRRPPSAAPPHVAAACTRRSGLGDTRSAHQGSGSSAPGPSPTGPGAAAATPDPAATAAEGSCRRTPTPSTSRAPRPQPRRAPPRRRRHGCRAPSPHRTPAPLLAKASPPPSSGAHTRFQRLVSGGGEVVEGREGGGEVQGFHPSRPRGGRPRRNEEDGVPASPKDPFQCALDNWNCCFTLLVKNAKYDIVVVLL
ncbi:hypothetical protein PVAP13_9NG680414 [Panicum virgatum]|uniref:Uncharacterized protein n=1 Tax=Panicum virgatum TaxID=38727 RepID=A0A8T0N315_PANVG|nr:hypothetical protein PVAP13_9NG680414 [Panicum virgatum]